MDLAYETKRIIDVCRAVCLSYQLARHDRWSRAVLLEHQQRRLVALVRYAVAHSEFYRDLYRAVDVMGSIKLADLPVIDKPAVMANFDRIVTDRRLKLANLQAHLRTLGRDDYYLGEYRVLATAGTSGFRGVFMFNRREWRIELANTLRWQRFMDATPRLFPRIKVSVIGADSPVHISARITESADIGLVKLQRLQATAPLYALVTSLNSFQPTVLLSYPSVAVLLAKEQRAGRLAISPRIISTHSELLTSDMARKIESAWGSKPFNHYGLTELPTFAVECELHSGIHMLDDLFIAELVDDSFRSIEPGRPSRRLLLTNLYNFTQPLIRYDVSDMLAVSPEPCACGRPFPLISSIAGRSEESLRLMGRDGGEVFVSPLVLSAAIESFDEVIEFQLYYASDLIRVGIVPQGETPEAALVERIAERLAECLSSLGAVPPKIVVEPISALERTGRAMGKVQRIQRAPRPSEVAAAKG